MRGARVRLDGARAATIEGARQRLVVVAMLFAAVFGLMALRTFDLGLIQGVSESPMMGRSEAVRPVSRADIIDRNGVVLATQITTATLGADPREISNAAAVVDQILHFHLSCSFSAFYPCLKLAHSELK